MPGTKDIEIKIILLGNTNVGKTSILGRIMDKYIEKPKQTVGAVFSIKTITYNDYNISMQIWDTAGQEKYHCLAPIYYHNTDIVFLVYSIDDQDSFSIVDYWVNSLDECGATPDIKFLIGNKCDLIDNIVITREEGNKKASNIDAVYYEVSAKTGDGIQDLLKSVAQLYIEKLNNGEITNKKNQIDEKHNSCC